MSKLINNKLMYELFEQDRNKQLSETNKEIAIIQITRERCLNYFDNSVMPIDISSVVLKSGKAPLILNPITNSEKLFNIRLKLFNEVHSAYLNKVNIKKGLQEHRMSFSIFSFILKRCNELIIKAIIWKGYKFSNLFLGKIEITYNKGAKKSIDWGVTMKNKQKLIAENILPYCRKDEEVAKLLNKPYHGVKYIDYIKDGNLFFQWNLGLAQYSRIPNIKNFKFYPFKDNGDGKSPCAELKRFKLTLSNEQLINFNTLTNGCN